MLINWQDINSVNIRELDEHHKFLVGLINRLNKDISPKEVGEIIRKLDDYASYHFAAEEKYFEEFNYPEAETHIQTHQFFKDKIKIFEEKYDKGGLTLEELMEFLSKWWINHINHTDLKYSDFLNQKGVY